MIAEWQVTAWERTYRSNDDLDNHYVEVETHYFNTEDQCVDWAFDNGFLNDDNFVVSVEDPETATRRHL